MTKVLAFDVSETLQTAAYDDDGGFGQLNEEVIVPGEESFPTYSVMIGGKKTAELLRDAQRKGIPIVLVTNNGNAYDDQVISRTLNFFEKYGITIEPENYMGPPPNENNGSKNPRLEAIRKKYNIVDKKELVFFDDSANNIVEAIKAGFTTVHVTDAEVLQQGIERHILQFSSNTLSADVSGLYPQKAQNIHDNLINAERVDNFDLFDSIEINNSPLSKLDSHIVVLKKRGDKNLSAFIDSLEKLYATLAISPNVNSKPKSLKEQRSEQAILQKTNIFLDAFLDDTQADTLDKKITIIRHYENAVYPHKDLKTICKCVGLVIVGALCFATGAAIGLGIGALAGAWLGPGAIVTAFAGMFSGAATGWTVGVTAGAGVAAVAGVTIASYYAFFKPAPPMQQAVNDLLQTSEHCAMGRLI